MLGLVVQHLENTASTSHFTLIYLDLSHYIIFLIWGYYFLSKILEQDYFLKNAIYLINQCQDILPSYVLNINNQLTGNVLNFNHAN